MFKNALFTSLTIAGLMLVTAGPLGVQAQDPASPTGCNADRSVVNVARSTASASVGDTITFTVEAGNPISNVDDGCDITQRTMTLTLPNGVTHSFGPYDYPYPTPLSIVGSANYVASAADLTGNSWTATISWTGVQKDGFDSVSTGSKGTSVNYVPLFLEVTKTANPSFDRTVTWEIDKSVNVSEHNLSVGQSGVSGYTVAVEKTSTDSNYGVSGVITIHNPALVSANITGVSDSVSGVGTVAVDCPVTFPYSLAAGASLVCTYNTSLPNVDTRTNTATVSTTGDVEGSSGEASISFSNVTPTLVGYNQITVTDTNSAFGGPRQTNADAVYNYDVTFFCNANAGENPNTATIVETEQSDSAMVTVNCANPSIDIEKATNGQDADSPTGPMIPVGDAVNWTYVVTNNGDVPLTNVVVTDNQGVTVTCPKNTLAVNESMTCTANGIAVEGQYSNIGSVSGYYGQTQVHDTDPSHYFGEALAGEWCSPGYWRQPHHLDSWVATGYSPDDLFLASFQGYVLPTAKKNSRFAPNENPTLIDVLSSPQIYGGDAFNKVGELLSDAHPDVNYTGTREGSCPLN